MVIDRTRFIELLCERSGLEPGDVETQLNALIAQIEDSTSRGKALEIKDFGAFQLDASGVLQFIPSEALQFEVNHRYAGLETIPSPSRPAKTATKSTPPSRETPASPVADSSPTTSDASPTAASIAKGAQDAKEGAPPKAASSTKKAPDAKEAASQAYPENSTAIGQYDSVDEDLDFNLDDDVESLKATPISSERMAELNANREHTSNPSEDLTSPDPSKPGTEEESAGAESPDTDQPSSQQVADLPVTRPGSTPRRLSHELESRTYPPLPPSATTGTSIGRLVSSYVRDPLSFAVILLSSFLILVSVILVGDFLFRTPAWEKEFIASSTFPAPDRDAGDLAVVQSDDAASNQRAASDAGANQGNDSAPNQRAGNDAASNKPPVLPAETTIAANADEGGGASTAAAPAPVEATGFPAQTPSSRKPQNTPSSSATATSGTRTAQASSPADRYGLTGGVEPRLDDAYTIVLFSFSREQNATDQVATLKAEGFRVLKKQVRSTSGVLWRVSVGQFASEQQARDIAVLLDEPYRSQHFIARQ